MFHAARGPDLRYNYADHGRDGYSIPAGDAVDLGLVDGGVAVPVDRSTSSGR